MNLPEYKNIRIRKTQDGKHEVLDILRQRFVTLTPEEWVRQHFVNFLIHHRGYPAALMANEIELTVGEKRLRCDTVLFDKERKPQMIIEYKAEAIPAFTPARRYSNPSASVYANSMSAVAPASCMW